MLDQIIFLLSVLATLVDHIQQNCNNEDQTSNEVLPVSAYTQKIQGIGDHAHEECSQKGSEDRTFTAVQAGAPNDRCRDNSQLHPCPDSHRARAKAGGDPQPRNTRE